MDILNQGGATPQEELSPVMRLAEEARAKSKAAMEAMATLDTFSPEWDAKEAEAEIYARLASDLHTADQRLQAGLTRLSKLQRLVK